MADVIVLFRLENLRENIQGIFEYFDCRVGGDAFFAETLEVEQFALFDADFVLQEGGSFIEGLMGFVIHVLDC